MSAFVFRSAEVAQYSNKIINLKEEIQTLLDNELQSEMEKLQQVWKSNASAAYNKQFQEIKVRFVDFYNAIQYMSDSVNKVNQVLNQTDQANNVSM